LEKEALWNVLNEDGGGVTGVRRVGPLPYRKPVGILEGKAVGRVRIGMRERGGGIPRRRGGGVGRSPDRRGLVSSRYLMACVDDARDVAAEVKWTPDLGPLVKV
jgi:hypothetical protein